jgi:hypothetical protein
LALKEQITLISGGDIRRREKLTKNKKLALKKEGTVLKYIEISDVTQYGLITKYIENTFDELPSRGEYQIHKGDILFALNTSSRGTVVLVPDDNAICTSGFLVLIPNNFDEGLLL